MTILPLRARVIAALEAAGYRNRENHLPTRSNGGTFSVVGSGSVNVTAEWWNGNERELLSRLATVLRAAGFEVYDRGDRLYVCEVADE